MAWTGDIDALRGLAKRIDRIGKTPARVKPKVAKRIAELIEEEFDAGADPYGNAWQSLADSTVARGRFAPPLTDTHEMRNDVRVRPDRAGVVSISIPHPAGVHQTGWDAPGNHGPARPILPTDGKMPPLWKEAIDIEVKAEIRGAA